MTLNGRPWLSRGVVLQGFVRPLAALESEPSEAQVLKARLNYGPAELMAIRAFHADTIRFQISHPALDPDSSLYDANYFDEIVRAIKTARRAGFVVMIMMQDETITGDTKEAPLPTAETQRDWDLLTPVFGADRGIVFEIYNEPSPAATSANWQLWLNGGLVQGETVPSIGMQTLVISSPTRRRYRLESPQAWNSEDPRSA
jgi:endoglucanase